MIIVKKLRRATLSEFLEANCFDLKLEETTNEEGQIVVEATIMYKALMLRMGAGTSVYYAITDLIKKLNIIAGRHMNNVFVPYITDLGKEVENKALV